MVAINGKTPFGSSADLLPQIIGPSSMKRFEDEAGWSVDRKNYSALSITSTLFNELYVESYKNRIYHIGTSLSLKNEASSHKRLAQQLQNCATKLTATCWKDAHNGYYVLSPHKDTLYIYMYDPERSPPEDIRHQEPCHA